MEVTFVCLFLVTQNTQVTVTYRDLCVLKYTDSVLDLFCSHELRSQSLTDYNFVLILNKSLNKEGVFNNKEINLPENFIVYTMSLMTRFTRDILKKTKIIQGVTNIFISYT